MRISIFGLGSVGCVNAACLAQFGHQIIAVDRDALKVEQVAQGCAPHFEPGLDSLLADAVRASRLQTTQNYVRAVLETELSFICVGTPGEADGRPNLEQLLGAVQDIGNGLRAKSEYHTIVIKSTLPPGTTEQHVIPLLEKVSQKRAGADVGVVVNPEFIREGTAIRDFYSPSMVVIGTSHTRAEQVLRDVYQFPDAPFFTTTVGAAEMCKYANNSFHALKVAFANEIGELCKAHNIDTNELMNLFCADTKLNISTAYLRPGNAFGGSCLVKDLRALTYQAQHTGLDLPLLAAILPSNERHKQRNLEFIQNFKGKRICILGLGFKPLTGDMRDSPTIDLASHLVRMGFQVHIYDPHFYATGNIAWSNPAARDLLGNLLITDSVDKTIQDAEMVILTLDDPRCRELLKFAGPGQVFIDLAERQPEPSEG